MTFTELQLSKPELANQLIEACGGDVTFAAAAWAEWVAEGVARERERCVGHIELAERSGNLKLAVDAIRDGRAVDEAAKFEHLSSASGWGAQLIARGAGKELA